ncbi:MAG TPA: hypothetical protein VMU54_23265 [Planctomycetota bacterium]|nr:hypothetical protein [Planctomycetota bacterium]
MTALLAFLSILAFTPDLTKEDVKRLVAAGVSDDVIVVFIRSHGPVSPLSTEDLIDLRAAQVSEKVLSAMVEASTVSAEEYTLPMTTGTPWYYPYGAYYDYYYGPFFWWYLGPGYYRSHRHDPYPYGYRHVPFGYRYPYGYHYPNYPYGYHWRPDPGDRHRNPIVPRTTPPRPPAVAPHSTPRGGGRH